jgi:hypothetical protein
MYFRKNGLIGISCVCVLIYLGLIFVLLVKNEGGRVIIFVFLADFFILLKI